MIGGNKMDKYADREKAIKEIEFYKKKNKELNRKTEELRKKALELERSYKNIKVIAEIGRKITESLDINKILNTIYKSINKMMDASIFGIAIYQEDRGIIEYKMLIEASVRQELEEVPVDDERSLAARCVRTKKMIVMNDIPDDLDLERTGEEEDEKVVRSLVFAPLLLKDKIIGVVMVQSYEKNAYNQRSLDTIDALASYIAIALNHSQKTVELRQKTMQLEELSRTDTLTKLYNRRYMFEKIEEEVHRVERNGNKFCIILADADEFKKINDSYGHGCGDFLLKNLSKVMQGTLRRKDFVARWGGEEFLFLLPDTDASQAKILGERIRQKIAGKKFTYDNKRIKLSMTFGIAEFDPKAGIDGTIRRADLSLYAGKRKGKNCVVVYDEGL